MAVIKIAGCAGHGGFKSINPKVYATPGKRDPDGVPEWVYNNKVIVAFEKELLTYDNVQFLRTDDRTGKTDVPLQTRTDKANAWGANLYISFHHNALKGVWGNHTGTVSYVQPGVGAKTKGIAQLIHNANVKAYGLYDRKLQEKNLHITRETKMSAVLIEGGFFDSIIDSKKIRDDKVLENAGKYTAQAVAQYYGLKKKVVTVSNPTVIKKEEDEMLEKAIVINTELDIAFARDIAVRHKIPIYFRSGLPAGKIAKEVLIVGGLNDTSFGDKTIFLGGKDRYEVAAAVKKFLG